MAKTSDTKLFVGYFREMIERGVSLPPSQYEAAFVSATHTERDIEKTLLVNRKALKSITS